MLIYVFLKFFENIGPLKNDFLLCIHRFEINPLSINTRKKINKDINLSC